uniref:Uncharacterized protein n=1 Tax=Lactuca sativa TaxID=4236 RepID=A0A9R1WIM5_LACSA|nr:hypothetical protein LSAT_V11C100025450 [Lactuca sativa]
MDPNQNTPPNYRNRKPDNAFALDTTPRQFPTMESPRGGFINLLQTETKAEMMTRMKQKMIEAQSSFQEAQETFQTKTDMEILKMKADDLEGDDLELFKR